MRIAIDARFLGPEGTGIGKYTEKLLENLQILDSENEYKVLLRRNNFSLFKPKSKNSFEHCLRKPAQKQMKNSQISIFRFFPTNHPQP